MEIGSKLAIKNLQEEIDPKTNEKYYKATVLEYVYNQTKRLGGSWEIVNYLAYIHNVDFPIEPANFDLGLDKLKYSFKNISNPDKSIIRVYGFKYEKQSIWTNKGYKQELDDSGKPKMKNVFYLTKVLPEKGTYRSPESKIERLKKEMEEIKKRPSKKCEHYREKIAKLNVIINDLRREINLLNQKLLKYDKILDKQKNKVLNAKNLIKQANRQTMVERRKNTIVKNQLIVTQNKLDEKKAEIKEVKKMKKNEIIQKAEDFEDIVFDDL